MTPLLSFDAPLRRAPVLPSEPATPVGSDEQTARWLADLRDPAHTPIGCGWIGSDPRDRCAVGWLLERTDGHWFKTSHGLLGHTAFKAVCARYGRVFIHRVIDMNESGVPWSVIADRIERREWWRALLSKVGWS